MIAGGVHAHFTRYFRRDRRKLSRICLNFLTGIIFSFQRWRTGECMPDERPEQVTDPVGNRGGLVFDSLQQIGQGQCLLEGWHLTLRRHSLLARSLCSPTWAADRCGIVRAAVIQSATTKHKPCVDLRNARLNDPIGWETTSVTGHWIRASRARIRE